jgi:hypothetical protein
MGPWKKFESTVVRLKRSYENTGSVVCLTTKGRQLERNFEELIPAVMSFRMSPDDTVACVSSEGPGPSPGGIAGHTNADQTSEGPDK